LAEILSDTSWIAVLIAGISAGGVTGSFLLSWWAQKKDNDRKYAEFIIEFSDDLIYLEEKKVNLGTKAEIIAWLFTQLNKLEQLAHLRKRGKIPDDALEFFRVIIEFAYDGLEELDYDKSQLTFGKYERRIRKIYWPNLVEWCEVNKISKPKNHAEWLTKLLDRNFPQYKD
jgi:hypothetical protein